MSEYSYGVVVEKYNPGFGIWLLFRGEKAFLSSLDPQLCSDTLRIGDIVQARTNEKETVIRRGWPFPDAVWSDRDRVVVRSIASFNKELTINRGSWKDESTDFSCVLLVSRDIGTIVAPVDWYNREFFDTGECNLLVYAEFRPGLVTSVRTGEHMEVFWRIRENRISLPAVPSRDQDPEKFLIWDQIRKVPVLTLLREGNKMLTWSYALGDHLAVLVVNDSSIEIGQWRMATVNRSSVGDCNSHGCTYTVVRHDPVLPYSQPEVVVDRGRFSMILSLNRSKNDNENPDSRINLWHEYWGLPINFESNTTEWIRGERKVFRAIVEVRVSMECDLRDRRVSIKTIGPAKMPRESKSPLPMPDSSTNIHMFEDLDELKNALEKERIKGTLEEWADLSESLPSDGRLPVEWMNNNNNNNNDDDDEWYTGTDQTTSPFDVRDDGWKKREVEMEKQRVTKVHTSPSSSIWNNIPRKEMRKNACTPKKSNTVKEVELNWRNCEKAIENTEDKQAVCHDSSSRGQVKAGPTAVSCVNPSKEEIAKNVEKGFPAPLPSTAHKPHSKSSFDSQNIVSTIPIREYDDTETEKKWKTQLKKQGWEMPPERETRIIPEGDEGWTQMGSTTLVSPPPPDKPPMPVETFLKKSSIVRDVMRLKTRRCLITKVRFDHNWNCADKIQLYVLDGIPALVVHTMYINEGKYSFLTGHPQFYTLGNIVNVNVGRNGEGFFVHDEMWRLVKRVELPFREVLFEQTRVKSIELIVNANCLSPEEQTRRNDMHRYNGRRFTMLTHELLHNIVYYGNEIDVREHEDYTFQVVVEPEESLAGDALWKVKEVLWRVRKEQLGFGPSAPPPQMAQKLWTPIKPIRPVNVELRSTVDYVHCKERPPSTNYSATVPRETRMQAVSNLYDRLLETERSNLMEALFGRIGIEYKKEFDDALEVTRTSNPHNTSLGRELQVNANFLHSIVKNSLSEGIFREYGEKKLWKSLVKTSENIKGFRSTGHNWK